MKIKLTGVKYFDHYPIMNKGYKYLEIDTFHTIELEVKYAKKGCVPCQS